MERVHLRYYVTTPFASLKCQESAWEEQENPGQIKFSLMSDPENNVEASRYPLLGDPTLLTEDKGQAVAKAASLERKLLRMPGDLNAYNLALEDLLKRVVLKEISDVGMASWNDPFGYINHHGVLEPGSVTPSLRVVSRCSLDDDGSDDALPSHPILCVRCSNLWLAGGCSSRRSCLPSPRPTTPS